MNISILQRGPAKYTYENLAGQNTTTLQSLEMVDKFPQNTHEKSSNLMKNCQKWAEIRLRQEVAVAAKVDKCM